MVDTYHHTEVPDSLHKVHHHSNRYNLVGHHADNSHLEDTYHYILGTVELHMDKVEVSHIYILVE